jgi:hypothetical protein
MQTEYIFEKKEQPCFAYLPEKDVVVEYDLACDERYANKYLYNEDWIFLGKGFYVYTCLDHGNDWNNPENLAVRVSDEEKYFFKKNF